MKEADITALLIKRHRRDFCLPQCKTGVGCKGYTERQRQVAALPLDHKAMNSYRKQMAALVSFDPGRIDVWALWREKNGMVNTIAYEIKCSRADFYGDRKFPDYWPYCNQFYFAVPNGMLSKSEINRLSPECGLIEVTATGQRLRIKRKPVRMNASGIEQTIFHYILMWRQGGSQ